MRQYLEDACEDIDASIFSWDVLHSDTEREELKEYLGRWQLELNDVFISFYERLLFGRMQ